MSILLYVTAIVLFMALVALFAGCETGMVSLDLAVLQRQVQGSHDARQRRLAEIVARPERFLAMTLIGTNLSIVAASSLGADLALRHLGPMESKS